MALIEGCKHALEITVPLEEVQAETEKVLKNIQQKAHLRGFRPGKAPASLIRSQFQGSIRQEVVENLVPKHFRKSVEAERLEVVGQPNITDVHYHDDEPIKFKAEFEVAQSFELGEYRELTVPYQQPEVADKDIDDRLERLRQQKAEYVNLDPRPLEDGDHALVSLANLSEGAAPDEVNIAVGDPDTLPAFTEIARGMSPGDIKEFDVSYPEEYGQARLAGKSIRFRLEVLTVRKKEMPELNDEFARDLGDFQNLGELRDAIRKSILRERESAAQQEARTKLVDKIVDSHVFPVPEAYVERQLELLLEQYGRQLMAQGVDLKSTRLDWEKFREGNRERAIRDIRASLLLDRIADREALVTTNDEVDREVQRIAKQDREPVAAVRRRLEKDGTLGRIAGHIRTEKTLNFLFEHSRKVAAE